MSIKKNILYSSVLTVSNFLFPLLVYPYISRVLGATNIGICNFVDSIINYFILFSMMKRLRLSMLFTVKLPTLVPIFSVDLSNMATILSP